MAIGRKNTVHGAIPLELDKEIKRNQEEIKKLGIELNYLESGIFVKERSQNIVLSKDEAIKLIRRIRGVG